VAAGSNRRLAIMSIHPQYAEAILSGQKGVEFRKRALASDVKSVLVYATSPVRKIIGEFMIAETVIGTPEELWNKFGDIGCIDSISYDRYYENSDVAVALVVESVRRLEAIPLSAFDPEPTVPQSFSYISVAHASTVIPGMASDGQLTFGDVLMTL
jgi:predicted transcriptional regulator